MFSIIIPSYNSAAYIEQALSSILMQREIGLEVEIIIVDGQSSDNTLQLLEKYQRRINHLIVEPDDGPANAINKGLALASGELLTWLNADDIYQPKALKRVADIYTSQREASFYFGRCSIIDEQSHEIRSWITRFKELFFPINSHFVFQCINYISQPATFFTRDAYHQAGPLREDMVAAWDYEFFLRLWHQGKGVLVNSSPIASFRWHEQSISGQNFTIQFKEELDAALKDAGKLSVQGIIHRAVRWGIVGAYSAMATKRRVF